MTWTDFWTWWALLVLLNALVWGIAALLSILIDLIYRRFL